MTPSIEMTLPRCLDGFVEPCARIAPAVDVPQELPSSATDDSSAWDIVDESSWESFPASDPPAWT